jgi:putative addiction module antidote
MGRKLFKTGNSLVVSLPKESVDLLGWREGSEIEVEIDLAGGRIILVSARPGLDGVTIDFAQQLDAFIAEYRPALEALAE